MALTTAGIVHRVPEWPRSAAVADAIDARSAFTDTIVSGRWKLSEGKVALVGLDRDELEYVGLATRGQAVATGLTRVHFTRLVRLDPFDPRELKDALPRRVAGAAIDALTSGGSVPPVTWNGIVSALRKVRPDWAYEIDDLEGTIVPRRPRKGRAYEVLAFEKDSVNLALSLSGFDRSSLQTWSGDPGFSFVKGLGAIQLREDEMIWNDLQVFGDWAFLRRSTNGIVEFERRGARLTVINANRTPLEKTLGVDLIYFNHEYGSCVVVQYKRLRKADDAWVYRPDSDRSFADEIERMRRIPSKPAPTSDLRGYRLHPGACYLKFCKPHDPNPTSIELIKGMYVPLSYWDTFYESDAAVGPRGGRYVSYDNIGRYFDNTTFISLVQKGWIGSPAPSTQSLRDVVMTSLERGHSVTLAAFFNDPPDDDLPHQEAPHDASSPF